MARNTSISLSDHFTSFIEKQVASGRYGSASEVVRDALRLLEDRDVKARAFYEAIDAGLASPDASPFDPQEFLAELHAKADAQ